MNDDLLDFDEEQVDYTNNVASGGTRFGNLIIDQIVFGVLVSSLLNYLMYGGILGQARSLDETINNLILNYLLYVAYYIVMEASFGKTVGKMVTGTEVISADGGKPTFGQIVGRSFARLIPFEAFSFLGEKAIGWHDSLSKTLVVKK